MRRSLRAALVLVLATAAAAAKGGDAVPASPLLPPDHWAVEAAERLYELGLVPGWMPAQRAAPVLAVARALAEGEERARSENPRAAPLARAWLERFDAEWPGAAGGLPDSGAKVLGGTAAVGFEAGTTRAAAPPNVDPGALLLSAPGASALVSGRGAAVVNDHLAAGATVRATSSAASFSAVELVGALGGWQLSIGRAPVGYGPNQLGAVVASGAAAVDRVELMSTSPFRLPGPLEFVGQFAFDTAVARFSEERHPYTPLLWELELQWRPHARLTVGVVRGVMFGGALWAGLPLGDAVLGALGLKNHMGSAEVRGLENNVYSLVAQYRLPTDAALPLTAKVEWGSDDNPGGALSWPGLIAGLSAPALPGLPASLGVEYAYFGPAFTSPGRSPFGWYTHDGYVGGWATHETPLGDPLGGNGRALRLLASVDPWGPRLRAAGSWWVADRFPDPNAPSVFSVLHRFVGNLYAPQAGGRSVGGRGEVELRLGRYALGLSGSYERGRDGWRRGELSASASVFL